MGATGQPYENEAAYEAALKRLSIPWDPPYSAAVKAAGELAADTWSGDPLNRTLAANVLAVAHDREALGLDASVHAASYRREVIEELAAQLESRGWHLGAQAVRELGGDHGEGIVGPRPETATGGPVPSLNAACLAEIKRLQHFIDEAFAHVIGRDCAAARIALTNARWGAPLPTEGTTDG